MYHAGPTNSGKTYTALQALRRAQSGAYCGPLRLLALEVADSLNEAGVWCNLVTGEEAKVGWQRMVVVVVAGALHGDTHCLLRRAMSCHAF